MKILISALLIIALASGCSTTKPTEKKEKLEASALVTEEQTLTLEEIDKNEAKKLFNEWVETRGNYRHF